jgi:BlaI family transcriptional regulator, penicillinase repressor
MARPASTTLTDAEQRLMTVLWRREEATVQEVADDLRSRHALAYTTVLSILRIMVDKGYVSFRKEGRAHIYRPLIGKDAVRSSALRTIVKTLFDGSPQKLAQHLIAEEKLTLADVEALRKELLEAQVKND